MQNVLRGMQLQHTPKTPEAAEHPDLVDLVADVSVALGEVLRRSPPLYRGLGRALAVLVLEVGNLDLNQSSATSRKLQLLLGRVAESLENSIRSDYVRDKYQQLTQHTTNAGFGFSLFQSWVTKPQIKCHADKWKKFPYPTLGMLNELVGSQFRDNIRLEDLLTDDRQIIEQLKKDIRAWNNLVDLAYDGGVDELDGHPADNAMLASFLDESSFRGETSIRHLSQALHQVLHNNWPCSVAGHKHEGMLGHCWSRRGLDPKDDSFFIVLTGSDILQECRVSLSSGRALEDSDTLVCQVNFEDSRFICLRLANDERNTLWPQPLGEPTETFQADDQYVEQSLRSLLSTVKPTYAAKRVLGVILARSFLHLLGGPWIPRSFCIDDISLFCRVDGERPYPFFDKVFLSTCFGPPSSAAPGQRRAFSVHPFPTILALGIILTEIELGDDLTELYSDPTVARLKSRPFELAKHLLRECQRRFHESGLLRTVKFCIERESFLRFANTSMDSLFSNQEFVNAFYMGAVRPLEQDLVSGAKWTWEEVRWLEPAKFDDEGVCRIITQLSTHKSPLVEVYERRVRPHSSSHMPAVPRSVTTLSQQGSRPFARSNPRSLSAPLGSQPSEHEWPWYQPVTPNTSLPPITRDDFEVAIICALPLEANAVLSGFDHFFNDDPPLANQASGDPNSYSMGTMGGQNVVLAHQPRMGKATAASVAAFCRASFRNIKLALLVGVCGGLPNNKREEILLGDVIVSKAVLQYDFGRQFADGFRPKIDVQNSLGRPNDRIASLLAKLETQMHRRKLQQQITQQLSTIQEPAFYPGEREDKLFPSGYRHKHQQSRTCKTCAECTNPTDPTCDQALESTCDDLGCDDAQLVRRSRQNAQNSPFVHIGLFASGDSVIKSGHHRDKISKETGAIGFEMEGAGVWDTIPCVIIKGVCDYADSHKNKLWQDYAAATAAACAKTFVRQW
ncbi:hypothetical protein BDW71DRAFT_200853 [Aspergillus fruticulosus]